MLHLRSLVPAPPCMMAMMVLLLASPMAVTEPAAEPAPRPAVAPAAHWLPTIWIAWCLDNALDPERLAAHATAAGWQALHPGLGDRATGRPATVQILPAWEIINDRTGRRLLASLLVDRSDGIDVTQCSVAGDGSAVDILEHLAQTVDFDSPITIDDRQAGRSYGFDFTHGGLAYRGSLIDLGPVAADRILLSATRF